jgi:hypothetical protein
MEDYMLGFVALGFVVGVPTGIVGAWLFLRWVAGDFEGPDWKPNKSPER